MAVDLLAKRDIIEVTIPGVGNKGIPQTSGVGGLWSAFTQIIAATTYPFILCGAYVCEVLYLTAPASVAAQLNLRIWTGPALGPTLVAENVGGLIGYAAVTDPTGLVTMLQTSRTHFYEPTLIPTGTRLSMTSSCNDATNPVYIAVILFGYDARYFAQPLKYINELRYIRGLFSQVQGTTTWPSPGATAVTSGTPAGTYGAAVQFIAAAASPLLITGAYGRNTLTAIGGRAQIGIGAPGSEQWMSLVGFPANPSFLGPLGDSNLYRPLFVKTGEAVSVRVETSTATRIINVALKGDALK
jgi:hypothetical protein